MKLRLRDRKGKGEAHASGRKAEERRGWHAPPVTTVAAAWAGWVLLRAGAARRNKRLGGTSSLREQGRSIAIVTTAALPWLTGTSINPLLRAAYLVKEDASRSVTLVIPWLSAHDQALVFPNGLRFDTRKAQEAHIREWLAGRVSFDVSKLAMAWYGGRYDASYGSVLPRGRGDVAAAVPRRSADVAVLEEPEHLNWFNSSSLWTHHFSHVVGIAHTNYVEYARRDRGEVSAQFLKHLNAFVCALHCHKVVKLSDAVQPLPRQVTCFVHGVGEPFLAVGDAAREAAAAGNTAFTAGAYFIGKAVWGKGYDELLELAKHYDTSVVTAGAPKMHWDIFGSGPDLPAIQARAALYRLDAAFLGARDHLDPSIRAYRCFVNPSLSDVVATTTAEALAMGKWVVVAKHPENDFFSSFANCLIYTSPAEFVQSVQHAAAHDPAPMTPEERERLTWESATQRFLDVASIAPHEWPSPQARARDCVLGVTFQLVLDVVRLGQTVLNGVTGIGGRLLKRQ